MTINVKFQEVTLVISYEFEHGSVTDITGIHTLHGDDVEGLFYITAMQDKLTEIVETANKEAYRYE